MMIMKKIFYVLKTLDFKKILLVTLFCYACVCLHRALSIYFEWSIPYSAVKDDLSFWEFYFHFSNTSLEHMQNWLEIIFIMPVLENFVVLLVPYWIIVRFLSQPNHMQIVKNIRLIVFIVFLLIIFPYNHEQNIGGLTFRATFIIASCMLYVFLSTLKQTNHLSSACVASVIFHSLYNASMYSWALMHFIIFNDG